MNAILKNLGARVALLLGLSGSAWLAACGGGVETGGTGGNATTYASGPITGFGSVIVGGVRFDDSGAAIDDGEDARRSRDDLKLGMTLEIEAGEIRRDGTATARRVRFESEIVGPVGAVDLSGSAFLVLGQRVTVDASTVFDERIVGGLAGLSTLDPVEVYAVFDPALQRYRATRVERSSLLPGLRLRGQLTQVDTTAQTLRIGSTSYGYAGASNVPAGLAAGQFVRLRLELDNLRWVVRGFGVALRSWSDADGLRVEGLVSGYTSVSSFAVNGRPVDAAAAQFPNGSAGLELGARVEVEGTVRNGVLRATRVSLKSDDDVRNRGFEVNGSITSVASGSFVVRGVTVATTGPGLVYQDGTAADLVVGRQVEARGLLSPDGRVLVATRIRLR